MGDYSSISQTVTKLVGEFAKPRGNLLELGCGTGNILKSFVDHYTIFGLDNSEGMLTFARQKLPKATFYLGDMTNFTLKPSFDVILCVFDSINHLTSYVEWQSLFKHTRKHLKKGGIFIFDMNTKKRLDSLSQMPTHVSKLDAKTLSAAKIVKEKANLYAVTFQIFENIQRKNILYIEEKVQEATFSLSVVKNMLKSNNFSLEKMVDPIRPKITPQTGRIFFVCKAL